MLTGWKIVATWILLALACWGVLIVSYIGIRQGAALGVGVGWLTGLTVGYILARQSAGGFNSTSGRNRNGW